MNKAISIGVPALVIGLIIGFGSGSSKQQEQASTNANQAAPQPDTNELRDFSSSSLPATSPNATSQASSPASTSTPVTTQKPTTTYSCGAKTTCNQISSCSEAYYYMNSCGLTRLDGDKDGVPCESICR